MPVAALLEFQIGDKDVGVDWYERGHADPGARRRTVR
jgi:hypothetical protein